MAHKPSSARKRSATSRTVVGDETAGGGGSATEDAPPIVSAKRLRYCALEPRPLPDLPPEVTSNPPRSRAIIVAGSKWLNHTILHYAFFKRGSPWSVPSSQADVIRAAFRQWKQQGIGLVFEEVTDLSEAEIRIGYLVGDGSWSYVGRDVLGIPLDERTMSFGWSLTQDDYGLTTALHEIGHTLGMPHEHQNPFAGIVWDEEAVYRFLGGPPNNWTRETTFHNVLRKLNQAEVQGSNWDPDSIMEYEFPDGLILEPAAYRVGIRPPGSLSGVDRQWARQWYPGDAPSPQRLEPFRSVSFRLDAGRQIDFSLRPTSSRDYTIATFGAADTVMVLFENVDGRPRFVAGDDDSGIARNARIRCRLRAGRAYFVRLRLYYPGLTGMSAVMYW